MATKRQDEEQEEGQEGREAQGQEGQAQEERHERKGRGFAGMDEERQRQISSQGGRAAHEKGSAHEFSSEEAREAGRKGGQASRGKNANRNR
jgi:general stress protein YciG